MPEKYNASSQKGFIDAGGGRGEEGTYSLTK